MIQEQTPQAQTAPAPEQAGSDEQAISAFEQLATPPQPPEEAEPDSEPTDDAVEEVSDDEPDADDEGADQLVEAEFEGKTYKVAPELQKALLRQADYSRNMNEVSAQKKVYTERVEKAEAYVESAEKYAEVLADVQGIEGQLKQFEAVNWQQLRAENPGEYAALAADVQTLRLTRDAHIRRAQNLGNEISQTRQQAMQEKRSEMVATLAKNLKGWGDELGTKITQYAIANGYAPQDLDTLTDARVVMALDKARRYDALQAEKTQLKTKAKDAPAVAKPGAPRKADPRADAMAQLRKDNSTESAEAAFLQRMR